MFSTWLECLDRGRSSLINNYINNCNIASAGVPSTLPSFNPAVANTLAANHISFGGYLARPPRSWECAVQPVLKFLGGVHNTSEGVLLQPCSTSHVTRRRLADHVM